MEAWIKDQINLLNDGFLKFNSPEKVMNIFRKDLTMELNITHCPECGSPLVFQSGCKYCPNCGWEACG